MRASARKPPKSLPLAKATGAGCRRAELALSQPRRLRAGSFPSSGSLPSWRTGLRPLLCTSSGEEGAAPRVCLLPVQDSCIPALVYSSAPGTCSDPTEGFWGTAFSPPRPSSPSPELLLEQDEQREEARSQQVRDCRSMLAWWLGNQLNPLRICSPWRHYSVPGGAGPYYRGHGAAPRSPFPSSCVVAHPRGQDLSHLLGTGAVPRRDKSTESQPRARLIHELSTP